MPSRLSNLKKIASSQNRNGPASRIVGSGEMAELIRAFDWTKTSVGPVETWSDTLITTVNLLLASRHPMFLWWGADLIQFYNDGYRPSIREDKHPTAIGQRGVECWPEIWPIIGPQINAVMSKGESTWNQNQLVPINRDGKLEEVYWTYGYSPVRDKDGTVQGTLVVCSETTEQVLSERRLRALLSIVVDSSVLAGTSPSHALSTLGRAIVGKLEGDPVDFAFAALYLIADAEIISAGSTLSMGGLAQPDRWPLAEVARSQNPLLIENLQPRFGQILCPPWPEPVTSAYILPLKMPGSSVDALLVFGISPRLPFDSSYRTFFQLVAARISTLMQSEVQKMDLAQANYRFSRLAEANPFGMVIAGLGGELKYINSVLLKTLGYSEAEVSAGKVRWDKLTPPEFAPLDAHAVRQLKESGHCDIYEKAYVSKDGRRIPILMGASIIDASASDPECAAFVTDLTPLKAAQEALRKANDQLEQKIKERTAALQAEILERERAETNLRELTARLLRTQDEERRHMARELHDHAGQTLVALGMNFSTMNEFAKNQDSQMIKLVADSQKLSEDLSQEIRTLSYLLHPPLLDEVGLESALRWYVEGFSQRSKIKVELEASSQVGRLPKDLELVIFRVVQEALTNIHRHSGSSSARIILNRSATAVEFEISDQGRGISQVAGKRMTIPQSGVGVRGMQERVRQFGGTLRIDSDDKGTKVKGEIPVTFSSP
jgi:PAS domain S-box-containing protein